MRPVSITSSEMIAIAGVSVNKDDYKKTKDRNQFSVKKPHSDTALPVSVELEFEEELCLNQIQLDFPLDEIHDINLFFSSDGNFWSRIPVTSLHKEKHSSALSFPLIRCRYMQVIFPHEKTPDTISGTASQYSQVRFEASSQKDRLWPPENLIDGRDGYGWCSDPQQKGTEQYVISEFENEYYIHSIRLKSTRQGFVHFPKKFVIELSRDKRDWHTPIKETNFSVAPSSWYSWSFRPYRAKYIRILIKEEKGQEHSEILELDVLALPENEVTFYNKNSYDQPEGSELVSGLVRFSEHNGIHSLRALQSSDPRLRDGTTEYPGIVKLAKDQESTPGLALQSNDSRISPSTENEAGLVRLAKDGESIPNAVVQSNDSRLRVSTTQYPGILQLAENNSSTPGRALQASDERLRDASTTWPGIVQMAKHGESHGKKVVRSDDPRLLEATEEIKGRIRFAKDRESRPLVAMQANDSRLKPATEETNGVMKFAKIGEKRKSLAVQANDPRLEDARKPLPHEHNYASENHTLNSHGGSLNLNLDQETKSDFIYNLVDLKSFPLSVKNRSGLSAGFQGGITVEGSHGPALDSFSKSNAAVKAKSKNKPGGVFFSEKDFGIYLPSQMDDLIGSSKSILAEGDCSFRRNLSFESGVSIAIEWHSFSNEIFTVGDLLTVENGLVSKLKNNHQPFVGVYVENASFCLSQTEQKKGAIQIAIFGVTNILVKGSIESGDWISCLDDEPGVARRISPIQKQHSFAVSMVSSKKESIKLVPCLIRR